ncbi:MAG: maiA [Nevskia sp.]|nr:maiA [Nevskia sp.]
MLTLYSYWRSSSSYRVRIALNLKLLDYELRTLHLLRNGGEQHADAYRALNPQEMVPLLVDGDFRLAQSLAIFQYLETLVPQPALVPDDAQAAAQMWMFCQTIACDIQPLQNTRVLQYLSGPLALGDAQKTEWVQHWIGKGLDALEAAQQAFTASPYCFGETPTYADCCLVPQLYQAQRFKLDLNRWPRLLAIRARCIAHPAFIAAHPAQQADAEPAATQAGT